VLMRLIPMPNDGRITNNPGGVDSCEPQNTIMVRRDTSIASTEEERGNDELALKKLVFGTVRIHGEVPKRLPPHYAFAILPSHVKVFIKDLDEDETRPLPSDYCISHRSEMDVEVCKNHNLIKWIASIIQLGYSCVTLYRVRGDQLELYGYAAFGLTVIPYAVMSIVNLIANIVTPDYPFLYMVRSDVMKELENKGYCFDGTVGTIEPDTDETSSAGWTHPNSCDC